MLDRELPDLQVIDDVAVASTALDPTRILILSALATAGSASRVGLALGIPRQKVNYHLRILEEQGLVRHVEDRARRGLTERVMIASARSYVVSPSAFGDCAVDPSRTDRLSVTYLIALAARVVREVADLARRAETSSKPAATLAVDVDIRFASVADRAAFAQDLTRTLMKNSRSRAGFRRG